jgi:transcriptional regulator with XRE-family HTH domain
MTKIALLKGLLKENGDTYSDFANIIKRSKTTVLSRFNGKSEFTRDELEKILQYYNLSEDRFLTIFFSK